MLGNTGNIFTTCPTVKSQSDCIVKQQIIYFIMNEVSHNCFYRWKKWIED